MIMEFTLNQDATKLVDEMVRTQNKLAETLGIPAYGFPSMRLHDVKSIDREARVKANAIARSAGVDEFSWQLHHSLKRGVYGVVQWQS